MIIKIAVKTPVGYAAKIEKKIKPFLLPHGTSHEVKTNKDDSCIVWVCDVDSRRAYKINRKVAMFDVVMKNVISSKMFKKIALRTLKDGAEGLQELEDMLVNHTKVEVVREF